MTDDERLLKEFDTLIDTIGTEVSSRISAQVSKEATRTLIKETIFTDLMQVQQNIVKLLQEVPKATQQISKSTQGLDKSNQMQQNILVAQANQTREFKDANDVANRRFNDALANFKAEADISQQKLNMAIGNLKASKIEQLLEKQGKNQGLQDIVNTQQSLFMKLERVNENLANLLGTCARLEGKVNRLNASVVALERKVNSTNNNETAYKSNY